MIKESPSMLKMVMMKIISNSNKDIISENNN
jgi:hypothetical protein